MWECNSAQGVSLGESEDRLSQQRLTSCSCSSALLFQHLAFSRIAAPQHQMFCYLRSRSYPHTQPFLHGRSLKLPHFRQAPCLPPPPPPRLPAWVLAGPWTTPVPPPPPPPPPAAASSRPLALSANPNRPVVTIPGKHTQHDLKPFQTRAWNSAGGPLQCQAVTADRLDIKTAGASIDVGRLVGQHCTLNAQPQPQHQDLCHASNQELGRYPSTQPPSPSQPPHHLKFSPDP